MKTKKEEFDDLMKYIRDNNEQNREYLRDKKLEQDSGAIKHVSEIKSTKEPFSERPDFESPRQMIIRLAEEYRCKGKLEKSSEEESSYAWGASRIWHDHVLPRDEKIQSLEQEIERLREELKSKQ